MVTDAHADTLNDAALLQLKKRLPAYSPPDAYFDALPDKIIHRIMYDVPESKVKRSIMISVAAVLILCITFASLRFHPHNQIASDALASNSFDEEYLWIQEDTFTEALYSDANALQTPEIVQDEYGNIIELIYEAD